MTQPTHDALVKALREISSATPGAHDCHGSDRHCSLCLGLINHAREVLGYEAWPAIPHTPRVADRNTE